MSSAESYADLPPPRTERDARFKLDKSWFRASDVYGAVQTVVHLGLLFGVLALAVPVWQWAGPVAAALLIVPVGVLTYKLTIVLHDCSHLTLFRTRRSNRVVGHIVGYLLGSEFNQFQRQHFLHHKVVGETGDPQGRDYLGLRDASRGLIVWHLARPLIGYNLFKLMSFQPPDAGGPKRRGPQTNHWRTVGFVAGTLAAQALVAAVATGFGTVWWTALIYPAAAATVALFLSQMRGFCEHIVASGSEEEAFVRTHLPNPVDRMLFYGLNFNYHVEHHLYPAVPSRMLPALYRTHGSRFHRADTVSPSIFQTVRSRLAQCPN